MKKIFSLNNLYLYLILVILSFNIYINFDISNFFESDGLSYKNLALKLLDNFIYEEEFFKVVETTWIFIFYL